MNALIARTRDFLERKRLQPDLNRAARSTVGFMGPMLAAYWWHLPIEASFAAIAAQNIAQIDVRGSYPLRLSLLLAMTVILAGATWLGGMTGANLPLALGAVVLLMLISGLWRHLNAEYGPSLATGLNARHQLIAERQASLRTALDLATATLAAAPSHDKRPSVRQLENLNLAAARFSTRFMAINASLETLMERPDFDALAPSFDPVIASLTNSARTVALTVVSRQPSHLAACEVRLKRLGNLLQALQDRVLTQTGHAPDGVQFTFLLRQISGLLPDVNEALRATIERADERSAFSLELFDIQTWTLRPLASALNLQWRPDPALVRFIARATVLQLIGVTIFKLLHLERGYWLPLTMLVVLQPEYGATRIRAGQRVIGTLAGSILASVLLWLSLPPALLMTAMACTIAGFAFWLKRNYAIAVFFITLFVVLITEISTHVTIAFTFERLAATAAGGMSSLLAALLFWPVWERQRLPALLALALRDNRNYVSILGQRLTTGGGYDAEVIAAKRAVELANGTVFASLQRMSADPKNQQARLGEAATLANGNQRLTHALTVVALHLSPGAPLIRPALVKFVELTTDAFEVLALSVENERGDNARLAACRHALDQLTLQVPKTPGTTALEQGVYTQFSRCATELSAMLIAALPTTEVTPAYEKV